MIISLRNQSFEMTNFDVFMTMVFSGLVSSAIFGTISLHFPMGRYLTKLMFCNLLMAFIMEIIFDCTSSIYIQLGGAFILSLSFVFIRISFSVYLGGLLLITGLSHLLKFGNLHRVLVNNFRVLTTAYDSDDSLWSLSRQNFINYQIKLNLLDFSLIMFYIVGATLITIRKEIYFRENPAHEDDLFRHSDAEEHNRRNAMNRREKCVVGIRSQQRLMIVSRCRRHHYRSNVIHERSPLISHWVNSSDTSDDEVFVSPRTNLRYMRTLSSDSRDRLNAIQNFNK